MYLKNNTYVTIFICILFFLITGCSKDTIASVNTLPETHSKWEIEKLADKIIIIEKGMNRPYISFNQNTKQVTGSGGCNNFFGSYSIKNNILQIGPIGSTRKICSKNNDLEYNFFKALKSADKIITDNYKLILFKNTKPIATFKQK